MIPTKGEEGKISRFDGKIVTKIYGSKKVVEGVYQRLMNSEVQKRLQVEDIVEAVKIQRLRWYGHIGRMGEEKIVEKMTE